MQLHANFAKINGEDCPVHNATQQVLHYPTGVCGGVKESAGWHAVLFAAGRVGK
jgi:hypothetical protein